MDAAPLSVQERWVIYTRCVCVCAMKMCVPASLLAMDLDCSVPSFKSLVLNWWKGALADSQAVLWGLQKSPSPRPVTNRSCNVVVPCLLLANIPSACVSSTHLRRNSFGLKEVSADTSVSPLRSYSLPFSLSSSSPHLSLHPHTIPVLPMQLSDNVPSCELWVKAINFNHIGKSFV